MSTLPLSVFAFSHSTGAVFDSSIDSDVADNKALDNEAVDNKAKRPAHEKDKSKITEPKLTTKPTTKPTKTEVATEINENANQMPSMAFLEYLAELDEVDGKLVGPIDLTDKNNSSQGKVTTTKEKEQQK